MTSKQIEKRQEEIRKIKNPSKKVQKEEEELWAREMINSCLIYGEMYNFYENGEWGRYGKEYKEKLGEKRTLELIEEQKADFAKATVKKDIATDNEGVVYNSIKWADDED